MKSIKNLLVAGVIIVAFALTSCYKEGAKISFRSKRDRLANEWSLTDYAVDGQTNDSMKKAWKSSGDSMELLFILTKGPSYGFGMQYTKSYSDAHDGKIFTTNKPEQPSTYQAIQNGFRDKVVFNQKLARGGNWTFMDKFRKIRFGIIGNPDVANDDPTDFLDVKILMLKDKGLKFEFVNDDNKTHTLTFEPRNPNAIK
jgi:hypothetical protein